MSPTSSGAFPICRFHKSYVSVWLTVAPGSISSLAALSGGSRQFARYESRGSLPSPHSATLRSVLVRSGGAGASVVGVFVQRKNRQLYRASRRRKTAAPPCTGAAQECQACSAAVWPVARRDGLTDARVDGPPGAFYADRQTDRPTKSQAESRAGP